MDFNARHVAIPAAAHAHDGWAQVLSRMVQPADVVRVDPFSGTKVTTITILRSPGGLGSLE